MKTTQFTKQEVTKIDTTQYIISASEMNPLHELGTDKTATAKVQEDGSVLVEITTLRVDGLL